VPPAWTNDRARCERAGIPEKHPFATKPQLARQMLKRAFDARVPGAWVTGASIYGDDRRLRVGLEEREQAYVLAVSGKEYVWRGWQQHQVKTVLAALPPTAGPGSVLARGLRGCAGMSGAGCRWPILCTPRGAAGCWYGGA
jgi:DDE superfamily endonuclease